MGRKKIRIETLDSLAKRRQTFRKRSKGLLKKAREISVLSGTDILVIAFPPAPAGTPSKPEFFCNRMEQVLRRFIQEIPNIPKEEIESTNPSSFSTQQQSVSHSGSQIPCANLLLSSQQHVESGHDYWPPSTYPSSSIQQHAESRQVYWTPNTDPSSSSMQVPNFPPRIQGEEQLPQAGTDARIREPPPGEEQLQHPGTPSSMLSSIGSLDYMGSPMVISEVFGLYGPLDYMGSSLVEWDEMFPIGGDVTPAINMPSLEGEEGLSCKKD